jgi:hypothetical protein
VVKVTFKNRAIASNDSAVSSSTNSHGLHPQGLTAAILSLQLEKVPIAGVRYHDHDMENPKKKKRETKNESIQLDKLPMAEERYTDRDMDGSEKKRREKNESIQLDKLPMAEERYHDHDMEDPEKKEREKKMKAYSWTSYPWREKARTTTTWRSLKKRKEKNESIQLDKVGYPWQRTLERRRHAGP